MEIEGRIQRAGGSGGKTNMFCSCDKTLPAKKYSGVEMSHTWEGGQFKGGDSMEQKIIAKAVEAKNNGSISDKRGKSNLRSFIEG